jgi:hypothetical protein
MTADEDMVIRAIDADGAAGTGRTFRLLLQEADQDRGRALDRRAGRRQPGLRRVNGDGFADIAVLVEGVTGLGQDDFWF